MGCSARPPQEDTGKALLHPSAVGIQRSLCVLCEAGTPGGRAGKGVPAAGWTHGRGGDGCRALSLAAACVQPVNVELDKASSLRGAETVVKVTCYFSGFVSSLPSKFVQMLYAQRRVKED